MNRYIALSLILLICAGAFCGCSADMVANDKAEHAVSETPQSEGLTLYSATVSSASGNTTAVAGNRKMIKTVSMSVETEQFDAMLTALNARIEADGGYAEAVDITDLHSASQRSASYIIRIPAEKISAFTEHLYENSNVLSRSEKQDDITLQYIDTESECAALRVEQERLMALLESAEDLSEILEIEARLTEIRHRLESVESQLRTYDNQINYATVSLYVYEVEVYTPTDEKSFGEKITEGFSASIEGVWKLIKMLFYTFIVALPYLFVLGFFAAVVLLIVFFFLRRQKKKRTPPKM